MRKLSKTGEIRGILSPPRLPFRHPGNCAESQGTTPTHLNSGAGEGKKRGSEPGHLGDPNRALKDAQEAARGLRCCAPASPELPGVRCANRAPAFWVKGELRPAAIFTGWRVWGDSNPDFEPGECYCPAHAGVR
jgi:hypothetical protein